jgi:hypothetical protein
MKTKKTISLLLFTFLMGLTTISYSQGIENNNGGFIQASSTNYIKFSGSGDMTLSGTTADQTTFGNMDIDFSSSTYKLTIPNDSYVTVDGSLTLSDSLLLEANSSANMASLICNGSVSGSKAIVQQHISTDQWHMVSSPVASALSGIYTGVYLYKWNEPDSTWAYITSVSEPLTVARGFHAYSASAISGPTDVVFTGLLNTGDYSPAITYNTGTDKGEGWNELGNPYPSALEWNSSWTKTNVDATIYIYDGTQYKTWNYVTGLGGLGNGEIPPTQGFWVKANAASPSITIPNAERIHSSNTFYKSGNNTQDVISISVTGNSHTDEMFIGMLPDATDGFDNEYDAYKLFGLEDAPQLYSHGNGTKFSVNLFPELTENKIIPLGLRLGSAGEYAFEAEDLEDFNATIGIWLKDNLTGSMTDLRENPVYVFYAENGLDEGRFELHFNFDVTEIEESLRDNDYHIYAFGTRVFVDYQINVPGNVLIYDMLGKEVLTEKLDMNQLNKLSVKNGSGYYVVKVVSALGMKTKKLWIR